jgi:hypothetical protein
LFTPCPLPALPGALELELELELAPSAQLTGVALNAIASITCPTRVSGWDLARDPLNVAMGAAAVIGMGLALLAPKCAVIDMWAPGNSDTRV